MLRKLKIENLAVIDSIEFELEGGLCVLTGETGAGKSLVVGAIELLLGARADSSKVRTGEESAFIEGIFQNREKTARVKRKITAAGRSYAWIDDLPVTIAELSERTVGFADLLGQHEHQSLLDSTKHIELLDNFGGFAGLSQEFKSEFYRSEEMSSNLGRLQRQLERNREKSRLREYEIRELSEAKLDSEEWEAICSKLARIDSAEKLLERAGLAVSALAEGEPCAIELISIAERAVVDLERLVPEVANVAEMLETAQTAISEAAREIADIADSVDVDPEEAEQLRGRQLFLERLQRKYARDINGLIEYLAEIEKSEEDIAQLEEEISKVERELSELRNTLRVSAAELTQRRETTVVKLKKKIVESLVPLGMDKVRFEVRFQRTPDKQSFALIPTGFETAEFLISPNLGEELRPLAAIVSGGELSRIMLALKSLIRSSDFEGIAVFDEVDTGIGGEIGNAVGLELQRLAKFGQILVITHLPQIARLADLHLRITKFEQAGRTRVAIDRLEGTEKIDELKRMHGGEPNILVAK